MLSSQSLPGIALWAALAGDVKRAPVCGSPFRRSRSLVVDQRRFAYPPVTFAGADCGS